MDSHQHKLYIHLTRAGFRQDGLSMVKCTLQCSLVPRPLPPEEWPGDEANFNDTHRQAITSVL